MKVTSLVKGGHAKIYKIGLVYLVNRVEALSDRVYPFFRKNQEPRF